MDNTGLSNIKVRVYLKFVTLLTYGFYILRAATTSFLLLSVSGAILSCLNELAVGMTLLAFRKLFLGNVR